MSASSTYVVNRGDYLKDEYKNSRDKKVCGTVLLLVDRDELDWLNDVIFCSPSVKDGLNLLTLVHRPPQSDQASRPM